MFGANGGGPLLYAFAFALTVGGPVGAEPSPAPDYGKFVGDSAVHRPASDLQCDEAFAALRDAVSDTKTSAESALTAGDDVQAKCAIAEADYAKILATLPPPRLVPPAKDSPAYRDASKWVGLDAMWVRAYSDLCAFEVAYALGPKTDEGLAAATASWNDLQAMQFEFKAVLQKEAGIEPHAKIDAATRARVERESDALPVSLQHLWGTARVSSSYVVRFFPGILRLR